MSTFSSRDNPDLPGQVIIVTGGNAGLGYETICQLGKNNPGRIYLASRSRTKAEQAMTQLNQENPGHTEIRFLQLDLASFESVKEAAAGFLRQETRLDILINNAGIMITPEDVTTDGYEIQFCTNVLRPALFTQLLLPTLRKTAEVNSQTRMNFDGLRTNAANRRTTQRYTTSKLANLHYARALAERETKVKIISVHPGMVATNLHHSSTGIFFRPFHHAVAYFAATPVEKGALSQDFAAVSPGAKHGQYYGPIGKAEIGFNLSRDHDLQERLFRWIQAELSPHVGTIM
ncbi:short chain dehydrogenase [Aspergillus eucalypticola CBS 122712]|uniref:Short chain dehydrogenase n=1 Tax=Aspergillus eucalypticola (strain CBS 122712 / IBT 29274) TaxID=1448314 RepID=A0A317UJ42_ASPEC|nr:short chain dehydrogenase [Aspergillus eucalypticola CBS 122712]PWY62094.1 short chain dehydrogenase [Aspergillus eucalypticola CBS 122712]